MVPIPPDVVVKSTLKPGVVYYFKEESFNVESSHYFIVVNINPQQDEVLLLVWSSSQIEKVRYRRRFCAPETLVYIEPGEYEFFDLKSVIDCNEIKEKTIEQIISRYAAEELHIMHQNIEPSLVEKLRNAVIDSRLIDERIKDMLRD